MKKYLILFAGFFTLAGCLKDPAPSQGGDITVQASIGTMTKVSYEGDGSAFASGDRIAVYAWTGSSTEVPATRVVDGVVNTFDGSAWTPASLMRWKSETDAHYFLGVSPVRSISSFTEDAFSLTPGDFTASDLLIATNIGGVTASGGPVSLGFSHAMAKLDVNLNFRSQWGSTPTVTSVNVTAKSSASVNYLAKAVTATGTAAAVSLTALESPVSGFARSYSGLQVPQSGVRQIIVHIGDTDFVYQAGEDIPLVPGKVTTVNLVVGRDKIVPGSMTITDWVSGEPFFSGDLLEGLNGHEYVDMGNGLKWATCNVGAVRPEEYGDFYAWAESETKDDFTSASYQWTLNNGVDIYYNILKYTYADGKTDAIWYQGGEFVGDGKTSYADYDYADDAARQQWGGPWRTPTVAEWLWLVNNCTWSWTTDYNGTGVSGKIATSNVPGFTDNSLFFPAAGYKNGSSISNRGDYCHLWSSENNYGFSFVAAEMAFSSSTPLNFDTITRFYGLSVRPVAD